MPRRQVANLQFATGTLTSDSTNGTPVFLGAPFVWFTVNGTFSSGSSSTVQLQGATSSGSTAATWIVLATIDNSTQSSYNSSAIACSWVRTRATAISSGTIVTNVAVAI